MEELRRRLGKIWRACHSPSRKNSTSNLFWLVQIWSKFFTPVPTCPHLFHLCTPVHSCSQLFTAVHSCSQLFTPQWLSMLFAQWQCLVEFSPCESCYFSILRATCILLKLHIFAHLIESYSTVYTLSSCIEKRIDPSSSPYYSDHVRLSRNVIFALSKALILRSYVLSWWKCISELA